MTRFLKQCLILSKYMSFLFGTMTLSTKFEKKRFIKMYHSSNIEKSHEAYVEISMSGFFAKFWYSINNESFHMSR